LENGPGIRYNQELARSRDHEDDRDPLACIEAQAEPDPVSLDEIDLDP